MAGCLGLAGLKPAPWSLMWSRCWRLQRGSPVRSCCCRFRSACWARRAQPSLRPICSTTWSPPPGALYRYWRQHQTGGRLALVLIAGTLPGVITGSVIRVELLPGPQAFDLVVAAVLVPLGIWLALTRPGRPDESDRPPPADPRSSPGGPRGCGGPRGRDLRNRRRLDPGTHPLGHYQKVLTTVYLQMDSWNRRPSMPWE